VSVSFHDALRRTVDILGQRTRIYHPGVNPVLVEVFLAAHPFALRALARRRRGHVLGLKDPAWLIAAEDLIVMKALHAAHPTRPHYKAAQDLADIAGIFETLGDRLDLALIRTEANAVGAVGALRPWIGSR
jgi:hypothetical protein